MKKIFSIFLFWVLIFSAGSFTSCSSDEIIVDEIIEATDAELRSADNGLMNPTINATFFADGAGLAEAVLDIHACWQEAENHTTSVTVDIFFHYGNGRFGGGIYAVHILSPGEVHRFTRVIGTNIFPNGGISPLDNPLPFVQMTVFRTSACGTIRDWHTVRRNVNVVPPGIIGQ